MTLIVDAVRTPIGKHGGALAGVRPDDMAASAISALLGRSPGLDPAQIDDVYFGDANGAGEDNRNVARMASLLAGMPPDRAGRDHQPAVRLRPGGRDRGRPGRAGRRRGHDHRWRRGVDDPRALGAAQARAGVPARPRDRVFHHAGLADGQSRDARRVDGRPRRGRRDPRGPVRDLARRAGRVRRAQPPARGRAWDARPVRRRGGGRWPGWNQTRASGRAPRRGSWPGSSPRSAPAEPSRPATPRS